MANIIEHTIGAGGGYDYTSLSNWEAAQNRNLVSADEIERAVCYTGQDTTSCVISGWTTDSTRYVEVVGAEGYRHQGYWNTSIYRLEVTDARCLNLVIDYFRVKNIQARMLSTGSANFSAVMQHNGSPTSGSNYFLVENCLFRLNMSGTALGNRALSILPNTKIDIINSIMREDAGSTKNSSIGILCSNTAEEINIYNCAVCGFSDGISTAESVARIINCILNNNDDDFVAESGSDTDYICSEIGDAPGSHSRNGSSGIVRFSSLSNSDFRLTSRDENARGRGINLYTDSQFNVTTDCRNVKRPPSGKFDIGPIQIKNQAAVSGAA